MKTEFLARVKNELPRCYPWVEGNLDLFFSSSDAPSGRQKPRRRITPNEIQKLVEAARKRYVGRRAKVSSRRMKSKRIGGTHTIPGWKGKVYDVRWKNGDLIIDMKDTQLRYRPAKEWQILCKGEKHIREELGI